MASENRGKSESAVEQGGMMGFSNRTYRLLLLGVPVCFVVQTLALAALPIRMPTSTLAFQLLGLGFVWAYSLYHVLWPQNYFQAFTEVVR